MKKVFLSYSYKDNEFVQRLVNRLRLNNVQLWYDADEIKPADSIKKKIEEGISSSSVLLFVLSKNALKSDWVKFELNSGLIHNSIKEGLRIIFIKLDDVEIPLELNGYQFIDFSENSTEPFEKLEKELESYPEVTYPKVNWGVLSPLIFENLVKELLENEGYTLTYTPKTRDGGYDFIGSHSHPSNINQKIIVEVKFYKNSISIDILRNLLGIGMTKGVHKIILVTNSGLTNSAKNFVATAPILFEVWEEQTLLQKLYKHTYLLEKYFNLKPLDKPKKLKLFDEKFIETHDFIQRLENCPEGKIGWRQYEDICSEILTYLFVPPLDEPKIQSRRENGVDIRDIVFPNRSKSGNWNFIREDYEAKYIVFEFKNYSEDGDEIGKHAVLQIGDYLKQTIGRFGIICSTKQPNYSGLEKRRDFFIEQKKLVIFLSNENLKEMLQRKYKEMEPSDVIIDLIDNFNLNF